MSTPKPPDWWKQAWAWHCAKYANQNISDLAGLAYWEDVARFTREVVIEGLADARRESRDFFPSARAVEEACQKAMQRARPDARPESALQLGEGERRKQGEDYSRIGSAASFMVDQQGVDWDSISNEDDLLQAARQRGWAERRDAH